jgi:hypothetical protein
MSANDASIYFTAEDGRILDALKALEAKEARRVLLEISGLPPDGSITAK